MFKPRPSPFLAEVRPHKIIFCATDRVNGEGLGSGLARAHSARCGIKRTRAIAIAFFPFSASWRIVLGEGIAGSALPQTKHIPMLLTCIIYTACSAIIHREAWTINAHYWLDMREGYVL